MIPMYKNVRGTPIRRKFRYQHKVLILLLIVAITFFCLGETFHLTGNPLRGGDVPDTKISHPNGENPAKGADGANAPEPEIKLPRADNLVKDAGGADAPKPEMRLPRGEDPDPIARERRNKVREMTMHAWQNYKLHAWGANELRPLSKGAHPGSVFGSHRLGATIVDSMDTLIMMNLTQEYQEGRKWIEDNFSFNHLNGDLSVFETTIRFVGGFLTLYALTGEALFKQKAQEVADKLLPAFDTPTGIPKALVNPKTGHSKNYGWAAGQNSILSEFGTIHLEFAYLSDVTGNPVYRERASKIRRHLKNLQKPNGLYPNYVNPDSGTWGQQHVSLGAMGDSFYEYLLKSWVQSGKTDAVARQMYDEAMEALVHNTIRTSAGGLLYTSEMMNGRLEHKMGHLACFSGGMFALGAATKQDHNSNRYMEIGKGITNTCHESYIRTPTGLGPEAFRFDDWSEARTTRSNEQYYILRPETVESYFVLWRLTHDQKYRDWGWEVVQALEKHCRSSGGYSGLHNVYLQNPEQDDVQQSFFIAETLKYLYLLYSDDSAFSLNEWVFNTEAHPLPIKGANPLYRQAY